MGLQALRDDIYNEYGIYLDGWTPLQVANLCETLQNYHDTLNHFTTVADHIKEEVLTALRKIGNQYPELHISIISGAPIDELENGDIEVE